ncbi:MAG: hypothetical protein J6S96_00265 [Muribaculaceae bacterium]|nr:hypothetical protein [Muribaculaceae bacterium]
MADFLASTPVNVIAESSSTRTEWALVQGDEVLEHAFTQGLNPYFMSRRDISHTIRLELPKEFFKRRWNNIYFYGAGCSNPDKIKTVEASLVAQFKTPVTVMSDLLGAARGLLIHGTGLACILGTGSNSCLYDGESIVHNVRSLGFILGDEGSGAALGRIFLGDAMKGIAPKALVEEFFDKFKVTVDDVMDSVYNNSSANRNLRTYAFFLADHLNDEYVYELLEKELGRFFERNICQYKDYQKYPLAFVGSVATTFSDILLQVAAKYEVVVQKIVRHSMPGLVTYHSS